MSFQAKANEYRAAHVALRVARRRLDALVQQSRTIQQQIDDATDALKRAEIDERAALTAMQTETEEI